MSSGFLDDIPDLDLPDGKRDKKKSELMSLLSFIFESDARNAATINAQFTAAMIYLFAATNARFAAILSRA